MILLRERALLQTAFPCARNGAASPVDWRPVACTANAEDPERVPASGGEVAGLLEHGTERNATQLRDKLSGKH
jgi:hypothetical protein